LEGPARRFARIRSIGITDAGEVLVFLIWQLPRWLLFGCRNSQERPSATCLRRGSPVMPLAHLAVPRAGPTLAAEPLLCQIR
jgi:hypothetical protein